MPPQHEAAPGAASITGGGLETAEMQPNVRFFDAAPNRGHRGQLGARMIASESPPQTLPRPADV